MGNCISKRRVTHNTNRPPPPPEDFRPSHITDPSYPMAAHNANAPLQFLNGGYWPSWKIYDGILPSAIDTKPLTHVNYAFASIDGDGTVYLADEHIHFEINIDNTNGGLRAWLEHKKHKADFRILLSIGGGTEGVTSQFASVVSDSEKVSNFVASALKLVQDFGLDGIDIDWEYPASEEQGQQFLNLLRQLRQALRPGNWLTAALPAGQWALEQIPVGEISEVLNFINLMAYDFVGSTFANVEFTGHHAQLFASSSGTSKTANQISGSAAVSYLIGRGVPSRKILLGIPTYARSFRGAKSLLQPFIKDGEENVYMVKDLPLPGMKEVYDEEAVGVCASNTEEFVTYDNRKSVQTKAEFVQQQKLLGLVFWTVTGDRIGNESLITAGYNILHGKGKETDGVPIS